MIRLITGEGLKGPQTAIPNKSQSGTKTPIKNDTPQVGRNEL